jgi:hypothetical protein
LIPDPANFEVRYRNQVIGKLSRFTNAFGFVFKELPG